MYLRWSITILLGLGWLLVVCANAQWLWKRVKDKDEHTTSPIAILGALFALGALAACPWQHPLKWALLVPALLLDVGSGFVIVMASLAVLGEGRTFLARQGGTGLSAFERRIARASWIIKLGIAFFTWFLLTGAALSTPGWRGKIITVVVVVYWPILLTWFWRLSKFSSQEKKS